MREDASGSVGETAVRAVGLGKRYRIGLGGRHGSIKDRMGRLLGSPDRVPHEASVMWALRDVSFEVPSGHVVGVLGRNGSGKTTLMRILARVTTPTEGHAMVNGRVGALFQVGTGFHPELTGRENIGLSGAILGMNEAETEAAFERIVAFAEIGDFLDTPVKYYSSGMYTRLAFSVSAHLEAEVMLIDEALSVGDAKFREKCAIHISEMVRSGRTVIYVSHSLPTVRELCDMAMVLDEGQLRYSGGTDDTIAFYEELTQRSGSAIGAKSATSA
ncbi:hypothetical protein BH23CHL8_BH23CHL8_09820 [soil metagenome]